MATLLSRSKLLQDKSVIITGASRGIGEAAARHFADLGAQVMLTARSADAIEGIASEINNSGGKAKAMACDVSDADQMKTVVDATVTAFGGVDVFIANAGLLEPVARVEDLAPADFTRVIDINVNGVFYGMHAVLPVMKKAGGGTIITIGSGAATGTLEGWSHYCTSKAAAHHLSACLNREEGENGIRALVLSPGTVATNMQKVIKASGVNPVSQLAWEDHIPPEWPARTLAWMCTADADDWLGQVIALREDEIRKRVGLI
ncbi:MAG: SDR family oxidoreductase [Pseudomonadota bacterium]